MSKVRCPNCRKTRFYFDSPSLIILHLVYNAGAFYLIDMERNKRVIRTIDRVAIFASEVADPVWAWTCENCDEIITSDMRQWKQLKKKALVFLR